MESEQYVFKVGICEPNGFQNYYASMLQGNDNEALNAG